MDLELGRRRIAFEWSMKFTHNNFLGIFAALHANDLARPRARLTVRVGQGHRQARAALSSSPDRELDRVRRLTLIDQRSSAALLPRALLDPAEQVASFNGELLQINKHLARPC